MFGKYVCLQKNCIIKKNGFTTVFGEGDPYSPVLWFHTVGSWEFNNVFGFKSWFCNYTGKLRLKDGSYIINQCESSYLSLV